MTLEVLGDVAKAAGAGTAALMAAALRVLWKQHQKDVEKIALLQEQRLLDVKSIYKEMIDHADAVRKAVESFTQKRGQHGETQSD